MTKVCRVLEVRVPLDIFVYTLVFSTVCLFLYPCVCVKGLLLWVFTCVMTITPSIYVLSPLFMKVGFLSTLLSVHNYSLSIRLSVCALALLGHLKCEFCATGDAKAFSKTQLRRAVKQKSVACKLCVDKKKDKMAESA